MQQLLIATHNTHKTREFREILGDSFEVHDLSALPGAVAPEETGNTFEENAAIKAVAASRLFDGFVVADDSGLEVDALGGEPGVRSARYAGGKTTDQLNCARLLAELEQVGARGKHRTGRFRCVLALARGGEVLGMFAGAVEGVIGTVRKGEGGFGYDPLFIPDGYCQTFAQLGSEVKHGLSHRGRALRKLRDFLGSYLAGR